MKITAATDFSYRLLIYAALCPDRLITVKEVAESYGVSVDHMAKVSKNLIKAGYLEGQRGRGGGMRLARAPEKISLKEVMENTEPEGGIVQCEAGNTGPCKILSGCRLKGMLFEAQQAFYEVMDKYTLADLVGQPSLTKKLLLLLEDEG